MKNEQSQVLKVLAVVYIIALMILYISNLYTIVMLLWQVPLLWVGHSIFKKRHNGKLSKYAWFDLLFLIVTGNLIIYGIWQ